MINKFAAVAVTLGLGMGATMLAGGTAHAAGAAGAGRAPLGPCNSPQGITFTSSGVNGGTSTVRNCFSTSKRVAFRIHNVVFPVSWDQTGACVTLKPGAKTSMRNSTGSYGFSWVSC